MTGLDGLAELKRWKWVGVPLLLGLLAAQVAGASARNSATFDEAYHLTAGYAYLRTGDPRLSWEHPPLVDALTALPLLARSDVVLPLDDSTWARADIVNFADVFLWQANLSRAPQLIRAGRWPVMGLAVLLGLALFLALRRFAGEPAAWLGLALYVLDPNVVANAAVTLNDLGLACFLFVAVWRLGIYLDCPTAPNFVLAGLSAGLALSSKFSGVLIGPIFLVVTLLYRPPNRSPLSPGRQVAALAGMGLLALLVVWAAYSFAIGTVREGGVPLPAPLYWRGMMAVRRRIVASTPMLLLGRIYDAGVWYYFPVLFLLKTPLPTLTLLGVGLWRARGSWQQAILWLAPAAAVLAAGMSSPLTISYRHILPALPFAVALGASGALLHARQRRAWHIGMALLIAWAAVGAARIYPYPLSFVNELGGGPRNAYRLSSDADWGQDLISLRDYVTAHKVERVQLSYFGSADPAAYGISFDPLPGFRRTLSGPAYFSYNPCTPPPGVYAISVNSLQMGLLYHQRDLYAFFRDRQPDAYAGHTIRIYRVEYPPGTPVDRAVLVGPAIMDVPCDALGAQPGRRLIVKWAASGALVLAGQGPARYVIQGALPPSSLHARLLAGPDSLADARPLLADLPAGPAGDETALPVRFANGLALAGYELSAARAAPGQTIDLVTYWHLENAPSPPLAVFVHLLAPDDAILTQWDGWPVAFSGLETGDVLVLHHPLPLPASAVPGDYVLQTGLYRAPAGARFITSDGRDAVRLAVVEIR